MYRDTVKVAAILNIGKEDFMKYLSRNPSIAMAESTYTLWSKEESFHQ